MLRLKSFDDISGVDACWLKAKHHSRSGLTAIRPTRRSEVLSFSTTTRSGHGQGIPRMFATRLLAKFWEDADIYRECQLTSGLSEDLVENASKFAFMAHVRARRGRKKSENLCPWHYFPEIPSCSYIVAAVGCCRRDRSHRSGAVIPAPWVFASRSSTSTGTMSYLSSHHGS
jgi:hypothetical protein